MSQESLFEKSFTPKIENIRENEYVNSKGETKKQCFIDVNSTTSLILPYDKETLCEKYKNKRFPEKLNISIKKDHMFRVAVTPKDGAGQTEYKEITGTELAHEINHFINIGLNDCEFVPLPKHDDLVSVRKGAYSFVVRGEWIRESEYGKYLSVRKNSPVTISKESKDKNGKSIYIKKDVSWNYVNRVFSKSKKKAKSTPIDEQIKQSEQLKDNQNESLSEPMKEDMMR